MDVRLMGHRPSYYELALKTLARAKAQQTLQCPACGKQNKPGARDIDLDDHETAWCPCGHCWAVRVEHGI